MGFLENFGRAIQGAFRGGGPHPPEAPDPAREAQEALNRMMQRADAEARLKSKKHHPKYSEAAADEILDLLRNVPVGSPLQGISFNRNTIVNFPALGNLIRDLRVIPLNERNESTYRILLKKIGDVSVLQNQIAPIAQNDSDIRSLDIISQKLENQAEQIRTSSLPDIRNQDFDNDLRVARSPQERNTPPTREVAHMGRAGTPVTPLDFTGHYGPLDPRTPEGEKRVYQYLREHQAEFSDTQDSDVEVPNPRDPMHRIRRKKYEVALDAYQQEIQRIMRETAHLADTGENLTVENSWKFTQMILRHQDNMQARVAMERGDTNYQKSRQMDQFGENEVHIRKTLDSFASSLDPEIRQNAGKLRTAIIEQVFYKLLNGVLSKPVQQHRDSFGLYEAAAMNELMDIVQGYEGGIQLASRLTNRMYGLFAAHDAVVIALNPEGNEESWKVLTTFSRNSFTMDMMEDPITEQLINMYERVLWDILKTFNGRIPPHFVEATASGRFTGDSMWDEMVYERFMQLVDAGVVYDAVRNNDGTVQKDDKGRSVVWDRAHPVRRSQFEGEGRLRLNAAMQQAKGFGLLSARLLEVFALQRVPTGQPEGQPDWNEKGRVFSSIAYEGMARYINPVHLFIKWHVADDKFQAYWNLIIGAGEGQGGVFDINEPKKVFDAIKRGTFEEEYPEKAQRFLEQYTWGMFSGRFGPWSSWGVQDSIIGMLDREREYLGGSIRLSMMNKTWAGEDVKEFLVEKEFKKKFLAELLASGKLQTRPPGVVHEGDEMVQTHRGSLAVDMEWFEREWRKAGKNEEPLLGIYTADVRAKWEKMATHGKPMAHAVEELTNEVKDIYNAMTWVQMATRSPHIVARNTFVMENYNGKLRKKALRDKILEEMYPGLDLEQFYDVGGNIQDAHKRWIREQIGVLEGDIDIVAHSALYEEAGPRAIRDNDFDKIKAMRQNAQGVWEEDRAESILRQTKAREYFRKTKKAILGTWEEQDWMDHLGLHYSDHGAGKNLILNWDNIWDDHHKHAKHHIDHVLEEANEAAQRDPTSAPYFQLTKEFLTKKQRYLLSTEDVVWNKMELINLGYRHWARRGADFEGHAKGLKAEMKYLTRNLSVSGDMKPIFESFHEISEAYEEDDKYWSEKKLGLHAEATAKFFKQGWQFSKTGLFGKLLALGMDSSIAQKVAGSRSAGAAWDSNKLFEFAHRLGAENLLPWKHADYISGTEMAYSVHQLEKEIGGTKFHSLYEAITLGLMMAWMLTIINGMTAPDEEKEGGHGSPH